jgi:DUF3006 family protein
MKKQASTKLAVDRIEGDLAVLVLYDDDGVKFDLPLRYLPDGVKEGDHLLMNFREDEASRASEQKRVDDLLKELKSR